MPVCYKVKKKDVRTLRLFCNFFNLLLALAKVPSVCIYADTHFNGFLYYNKGTSVLCPELNKTVYFFQLGVKYLIPVENEGKDSQSATINSLSYMFNWSPINRPTLTRMA